MLLLFLDRIEHLRQTRRVSGVPAPVPLFDLFWVQVKVEEDRGTLDKGPYEHVPSEQVPLSDEFSDRQHDAERPRDYLARHALLVGEGPAVRLRCRGSVLLHRRADDLVEAKQKVPTETWLVVWGENYGYRVGEASSLGLEFRRNHTIPCLGIFHDSSRWQVTGDYTR